MADLSVTPVALGIKPAAATSLADMLNIAGAAQQYQQAQQINPLAIKKAEQDLANSALQQQTNQFTLDKDKQNYLIQSRNRLLNLVSNDAPVDVISSAAQEISAMADSMGIPAHGSNMLNAVVDLVGKGDRKTAQQILMGGAAAGTTPSEALGLATPANVTVGGQPGLQNKLTGRITSALLPESIGVTPSAMGQPKEAPKMGVTAEAMGKSESSKSEPLPYPVRQAGVPYAQLPSEEADRTKGQSYKTGLIERQNNLSTARRNLDEVIAVSNKLENEKWFTNGLLGAASRNISNWFGDPTYKQLSKDLANVQIANIQAQGGSMDTVSGQQLTKMANGDETYPPQVLINIARRAYADLENIDKQATAARKFSDKFGDQNMNAFKSMWAKNADSKIFETMAIYNNVKDPKERKKQIDELLGSDKKQRQQFYEKYNNINKLVQDGTL